MCSTPLLEWHAFVVLFQTFNYWRKGCIWIIHKNQNTYIQRHWHVMQKYAHSQVSQLFKDCFWSKPDETSSWHHELQSFILRVPHCPKQELHQLGKFDWLHFISCWNIRGIFVFDQILWFRNSIPWGQMYLKLRALKVRLLWKRMLKGPWNVVAWGRVSQPIWMLNLRVLLVSSSFKCQLLLLQSLIFMIFQSG